MHGCGLTFLCIEYIRQAVIGISLWGPLDLDLPFSKQVG